MNKKDWKKPKLPKIQETNSNNDDRVLREFINQQELVCF